MGEEVDEMTKAGGACKADMAPSEGSISRATAESEDGHVVRLYRHDDRLLTYGELYDEVDAEGSELPPEQWIDGVWDCHGYIVEACLVGIYDVVEVLAAVLIRDTGEAVVEYSGDDDDVVAERKVVAE